MTFIAPWFLLALLSVAIPLILHLRRSRRTQKIVFSTTQFFDEDFIRSARRARIQDILLMMLRMALLAFFALALAQPLVRSKGLAGLLGLGRDARRVGIVLDDSASMGALSERGVLLERAKAGALAVLDELSVARGDKATVVLAGRRGAGPRALFDEPTADIEALRRAVREITLSDLATDLAGAIRAAAQSLGAADASPGSGVRGGAEIYVFSDFQESALPAGQSVALGPRAALLLVSTQSATRQTPELSVDVIQYGAARPMLGVPFAFRAALTNHGTAPTTAAVSLVVNDQTTSRKEIQMPAGRARIVRFTHRFAKPGWRRGRIEIVPSEGADALVVDNRRHFAVFVEDRLRVLAVNGAPSEIAARDELFFFRLALSVQPDDAAPAGAATATAPVLVDQITPAELTLPRLGDSRLVILANVSNLSPSALEALEHYVDRGGSLAITLGDRVDPKAYNAWVGEHRLHGGLLPGRLTKLIETPDEVAALPVQAPEDAGFIASVNEKHPALAGFGAGDLGSLSSVRFTTRYEIEPGGADVLMRGPSGEALLVERRFGQGRVMLFASTIDRDWTSFPLQPTYVPWLYRMVSYLAAQRTGRANFVRTGEVVALPASTTQSQPLRITRPDGASGYAEPDPRDPAATTANVFTDTERAGVYTVRSTGDSETGTPQLLFAANTPPEESDPRPLDREELEMAVGPDTPLAMIDEPESVTEAGRLARQGYGLWDVLLGVALLAALVEPWIANRLSRRRAAQVADVMNRRDVLPVAERGAA